MRAETVIVPLQPSMDLSGTWRFELDPLDRGVAERWFTRRLSESIALPGDLVQRGFGPDVSVETHWTGSIFDPSFYTAERYAAYRQSGNIKFPFWLQPDRAYSGAAWYQFEIVVPPDWKNRRLALSLERAHWATKVWWDEQPLGEQLSLSTPHEYEIGHGISAGSHQLTIRVDNSRIVDVGENSHSISDHTQGNWNGLIGRIQIVTTASAWISRLQVYPKLEPRSVTVRGVVSTSGNEALPSSVEICVTPPSSGKDPKVGITRTFFLAGDGTGHFEGEITLPADAPLWDEFSPKLHTLTATLPNGEAKTVRFGLRVVSAAGEQLLINGRPLFIRGTLECAIFPKTGHPPTDVASWARIIRIARSHGLNSLRFHSWCPPEAAFQAGDEHGFYFQVEAASWPNQSTTLGDGKPVDAWLEEESIRILNTYGNHPSFLLMASSNEPGGKAANSFLSGWLLRRRAEDPRRLYTSGAGWPEVPENQFHVHSDPRIQHWEEGLKSRINAHPPETRTDYTSFVSARAVPVISHEIGQWCVYPNLREIPKYDGYLKPKNFEIFRDRLQASGLQDLADDFLIASGKLQVLCYKEDIEAALRTPKMAGFQLLGLQDFPGQGTALVGVVDPFWEAKPYVDGAAFRRFCNATVPLARLEKRVFTTAESLVASCEVAHFGAAPLKGVSPFWRVLDQAGAVVQEGPFPICDVSLGHGNRIGELKVALHALPAPAKYTLVLSLSGTIQNDWDFWVYPANGDARSSLSEAPSSPLLCHDIGQALSELKAGRTVLLSLKPEVVRNDRDLPVKLGFSSIFWNTSWTHRQAPTTLGVLCDPKHPALTHFPTESHSNWHWWYIVHRTAPLLLETLPREIQPIVRVIDDWFTARSLALLIEAKVGSGKLLLTSVDLEAPDDPVLNQFRASLLAYAGTASFSPAATLTEAQVRSLLAEA